MKKFHKAKQASNRHKRKNNPKSFHGKKYRINGYKKKQDFMFDIFEIKMVKQKNKVPPLLWLRNVWVGVPFLSFVYPTHSYIGDKNGYR